MTRQQFLDMVGAANLIPGPTSTELAINVGFARAGWMGLTVAGASFILPAALITGAFAWAYVRFGALPQTASVLAGIKAAVIAVIAIAILFGGGLVGMLARRLMLPRATAALFSWPMLLRRLFVSDAAGAPWTGFLRSTGAVAISLGVAAQAATRPSLRSIALFFLKVGAVLYGGGYVLLAFLEQGLVRQNAWLKHQQLLDAVAIGQFTPGCSRRQRSLGTSWEACRAPPWLQWQFSCRRFSMSRCWPRYCLACGSRRGWRRSWIR